MLMKRLISIIAIGLSVCMAGMAQSKTTLQERIDRWKNDMEEFRQRSASDRAEEKILDTLAWRHAGAAVSGKSFVVEADAITFKNGVRAYVNSMTNFVAVNGDRGVVQVSPSDFAPGPNGVGGVTVDGIVTGYEVTSDKKGRIRITMNISGAVINARVDISMHPESDNVQVVVSPNFNSQTIRLEGKLVPYRFSRVIEGVSI